MEKDFNGYEYVDLGLPSGILWAKCNVGATSEEDYGLYFAWGETVGYTKEQIESGVHSFDSNTYKSGTVASITSDLSGDNDAATANLGSPWRMPTTDECKELCDNTSQVDATINGVKGMKFISKTDSSKYIFFPFAGYSISNAIFRTDNYGSIWSSTMYDSLLAYGLDCCDFDDAPSHNYHLHSHGQSIRGIME